MKDETYLFIQDVKEKGSTARSARNRRTHNGKGGRVKLPSDNLSRKELQKMNGDVKTYRLNEPMTLEEFKSMPDDIKVTYVKLLRERFDVPDYKIGEMMGANKDQIWLMFKKLGLNGTSKKKRKDWNSEGWCAFVNGVPVPVTDPVEVDEDTPEKCPENLDDIKAEGNFFCEPVHAPEIPALPINWGKKKAIPASGNMTFVGSAEAALNAVSSLLGGADVHITITWEVCD